MIGVARGAEGVTTAAGATGATRGGATGAAGAPPMLLSTTGALMSGAASVGTTFLGASGITFLTVTVRLIIFSGTAAAGAIGAVTGTSTAALG
ncbi:MAG: hypothetical protein EOP10_31855 [Proteobacteria bacterium]|nr:MAG: hypothetical protein EOP10_31855 [Pseudomonadota bacterium]